ncbi:MAG: peptidase MA family metallohydrolase [Gemmatimonadota bacterium]
MPRGTRARPGRRSRALLLVAACAAGGLSASAQDEAEEAPRSLARDSIRVWYWTGDETFAERALGAVPSFRFPGLPDDAWRVGPPLSITLAPDVSTLRRLAPGAPEWGAGFAAPERRSLVIPLRGPQRRPDEWRSTLHHEVAHIALHEYLRARIPRWFDEGYAQFAAGTWDADAAWQLRLAILLGQAPTLDSLTLDYAATAPRARVAYLLSYTAVRDLYELSGPDAFRILLRRWREGGDLDAAMRRTYGLTLGHFERLWREDVRSRYGWLLIVSETVVLWTTFTLLFLALGAWARRRRRRQYAALEARETAEASAATEPAEPPPATEPRVDRAPDPP